MKIIFNDGQELQIQQAEIQNDGALLIKTISADEMQLKKIFSDTTSTKKMIVSERGADGCIYERYTKFDAIVKYTAGIIGIVMYQDMKEQIEQLQGCILEMSELVYQY